MTFTSNEKCAIVSVLSSIMKADGVVQSDELTFLNDSYRQLGINIEDFQHIAAFDTAECRRIFSEMTEEKRQLVEKCFLQMVGIDGKVDLRELRVLKSMV